jgi:hypothetical protein
VRCGCSDDDASIPPLYEIDVVAGPPPHVFHAPVEHPNLFGPADVVTPDDLACLWTVPESERVLFSTRVEHMPQLSQICPDYKTAMETLRSFETKNCDVPTPSELEEFLASRASEADEWRAFLQSYPTSSSSYERVEPLYDVKPPLGMHPSSCLVPDPNDADFDARCDDMVELLVDRSQYHDIGCRSSCFTGKLGPKVCRYGFPREVIPESFVSDAGVLHLRRQHAWLTFYNPWILLAARCNTDIKFVTGACVRLRAWLTRV